MLHKAECILFNVSDKQCYRRLHNYAINVTTYGNANLFFKTVRTTASVERLFLALRANYSVLHST